MKILRRDVPSLHGIIGYTEDITALKVFNVEILRQSSNGNCGAKETLFGWHKDTEDRKMKAKLTVIILLSPTDSSMQVMTKSKIVYVRQGTVLTFPLGLYHRLVHAEEKNKGIMPIPRRLGTGY